MIWQLLTIFGTWVYHHEKMWHVHSCSRFDADLWPQGQILKAFVMSSCSTCNFCLLWHWHTIFGTWVYHHDPNTILTFDLKVKFIRFDTALCSGLSFFVLWHSHTLFGTLLYHHGTMCCVHSWTLYDLDLWPQYQNYIFTIDLSLAIYLCSLT